MTTEQMILWLVFGISALNGLINFFIALLSWLRKSRRPDSSEGEKISIEEICELLEVLKLGTDELLNHPIIKQYCLDNNIDPSTIPALLDAVCQAYSWQAITEKVSMAVT
jgi:hypothetical protein